MEDVCPLCFEPIDEYSGCQSEDCDSEAQDGGDYCRECEERLNAEDQEYALSLEERD